MKIEIEEVELRKILVKELNKHLYTPIGTSELVKQKTQEAIEEFLDEICSVLKGK